MHPLARLVRGTDGRRTRFHTGRGRLMPLRGWLDLPASVWHRLRGGEPSAPWLVPAAVRFLEGWLSANPGARVLEAGSGASTVWYSARAARVLSLEDDPAWHARVRDELGRAGARNCELQLVAPGELPERIAALPDEAFNLIVIDSNEAPGASRVETAGAALPKLMRGGLFVVDDLDWPHLRPIDAMLESMPARHFAGIKSRPLTAAETAVFERPPA